MPHLKPGGTFQHSSVGAPMKLSILPPGKMDGFWIRSFPIGGPVPFQRANCYLSRKTNGGFTWKSPLWKGTSSKPLFWGSVLVFFGGAKDQKAIIVFKENIHPQLFIHLSIHLSPFWRVIYPMNTDSMRCIWGWSLKGPHPKGCVSICRIPQAVGTSAADVARLREASTTLERRLSHLGRSEDLILKERCVHILYIMYIYIYLVYVHIYIYIYIHNLGKIHIV